MIGSAQPAGASQRLPLRLGALADERLARLVSAGRERAFAVLYERYHQPLYRYCRSMLRNDADAQDALQSTFTSALTALRDGKRNAPFRPWLFRIAHNESVSMIRRRRETGQEISDSLLPSAASASEEADDRARMTLLIADLAELPERQRAALLMRELNGLSHADIAVALATTVAAAKQAIFDARTALLEFSEGRALSCDEVRRKISERDGRVLRGRRMRSHLRDCSGCATFAAAIPARRSDLRAVAPLLPAAASASLLARLGSSASMSGKLGGTALASKAAVGATIAVTAAAGLGALPKVLPFVARGGTPAAHAVPSTHGAKRGAARTPARPSAANSGSSLAAAHPRANSVAGPPEHHSASGRHARRGHASAHAGTTSAVGTASTPASTGASAIASAPGHSALAHGHSGLPHGQSGLPHGRSAQAPGHTGTARAGSSSAHGSPTAHRSKAVHVSPGLTGTSGKSASSPGHIKSSSAKSEQASVATPPGQAAKGTSQLLKSHAK